MSYTPTEWQNGDIITAEKLNKIENNIGGALIVNYDDITETLDKTAKQITDAVNNGKIIYMKQQINQQINGKNSVYLGFGIPSEIAYVVQEGMYAFHITVNNIDLETNSENGYPKKHSLNSNS